jgi:ABC-type Fe3+ transport system permease subunit
MDQRSGNTHRTAGQNFEVVLWLIQIVSGLAIAVGIVRTLQDASDWGLPTTLGGLIIFLTVRHLLQPTPRRGEEGSRPEVESAKNDERMR